MTDDLAVRPPAPGEWHPAYQCDALAAALRDFLESSMSTTLRLPFPPPCRFPAAVEPLVPELGELPCHVLTKRKVMGPAPYVGRPFVYVWRCAIDELGRAVAGPAHIVYTSDDTIYDWSDPNDVRSS